MSEVRPRIQFYATVDLERVEEPLNGMVLSVPDKQQPIINDLVLKRGSYFTGHRRNEVLVNDSFAAKHGLYPGQWVHLLLNNRREELFIVGTAISSEFVYWSVPVRWRPIPSISASFICRSLMRKRSSISTARRIKWWDCSRPRSAIGRMRCFARPKRGSRRSASSRRSARKEQPSNRFLSDEIAGLGTFAGIMPTIFLAVAALVLNVLMVRLIDQQRAVIGTLKGLGYSDAQIFLHFTKFGGLIGLASGLIGCCLGYEMAGFVTTLYRQFFEFPNLVNYFYPGLSAAGLTISLCLRLDRLDARCASRLAAAAGRGDAAPPAGGRRPDLARAIRGALAAARLRLADGLAKCRAASAANDRRRVFDRDGGRADDRRLHAPRGGGIHHRLPIRAGDAERRRSDVQGRARYRCRRVKPAVCRASIVAEPAARRGLRVLSRSFHHKGAISGLADDARLTMPRDMAGHVVRVPPAGVVMTRKLAQLLNVTRGDAIEMEPIKGLRRRVTVPVVEIADSYIGIAVYANIHYLSRLIGEELATSAVQLQVDPSESAKRELFRAVKRLPAVQMYSSRLEYDPQCDRDRAQDAGDFHRPAGAVRRSHLSHEPAEHVADRPGGAAPRGGHAPRARLYRMADRRLLSPRKPAGDCAGHVAGNAAGLWAMRVGDETVRYGDVSLSVGRAAERLD